MSEYTSLAPPPLNFFQKTQVNFRPRRGAETAGHRLRRPPPGGPEGGFSLRFLATRVNLGKDRLNYLIVVGQQL